MDSDEIEVQLSRLVALGYPDVAELTRAEFRALAVPLIESVRETPVDGEGILVPTRELVSSESLIARTSLERLAGFTTMPPRDIASFRPVSGHEPPEGPFYLLEDPDVGAKYRSATPDDAVRRIGRAHRIPLTLEEGLAIATQHPEWLRERGGFAMTGSRAPDRRVPGVWLSGGAPRLGSCWGTSHHTWLGMAHARRRRPSDGPWAS